MQLCRGSRPVACVTRHPFSGAWLCLLLACSARNICHPNRCRDPPWRFPRVGDRGHPLLRLAWAVQRLHRSPIAFIDVFVIIIVVARRRQQFVCSHQLLQHCNIVISIIAIVVDFPHHFSVVIAICRSIAAPAAVCCPGCLFCPGRQAAHSIAAPAAVCCPACLFCSGRQAAPS